MSKVNLLVLEDILNGKADYIVRKKSFRKNIANMLFDSITIKEKEVLISYRGKELASWKIPAVDYKNGQTLTWRVTEGIMKVRLLNN